MNKLIDSLFEKDSVIKVISILTAVLIWFLVLDQDNPFEERTLAIPLSSNLEVLQTNNLQIVGTQLPASIDIKIKGRRKKISGITSNDFKALLDLSGVTDSGTKRINIDTPKYLGDDDIIISSINPTSLVLNFERRLGAQFPVNVEFTGKLPEGYELVNLKVEPTYASLTERESSIAKVNKVVARINLNEVKDNKEIGMRGTVLDSDGKVLHQFDNAVPVIVTFDLAKRVPVLATSKGEPATDWYMKEIRYSLPAVRVVGPRSVLDGLIRLNAEDVDITGVSETFRMPLVLVLPNGTSVYKEDADMLSAEVVMERYATRAISVPTSSITIYESDVTGAKEYRVSEASIDISIKGKNDIINTVKTEDIRLSVKVSGLGQGEHVVPLNVQVPGNTNLVGEYTVKVIITDAPKDQETSGTPNSANP